MTDIERIAINYAERARVLRASAEAYLDCESRELIANGEAQNELASDYEIIAAALREKAEREKGCDGWISVKDRAPEVETEVFIFAVSPNGTVTKTTAIYEDGSVPVDDSMWSWVDMAFEYDETNGYNVIPEGWFEYRHYNPDDVYNNVVDGTVTHWQPLPEPPQ